MKEKVKYWLLITGVAMWVTLVVDILNAFLTRDTVLGLLIATISVGIADSKLR